MFGHLILAFTTFAVTNVDDILLLTFYFASGRFKTRSIVLGQYLGISALIIVSLSALVIGAIVPDRWLAILGIFPIILGVKALITKINDDTPETAESNTPIVQVATVTIANGGDNLGVYMPLFAKTPLQILPIYIITFLLLTGVWCALGKYFVSHPLLKNKIHSYGEKLFSFFLIALGLFILSDFLK
jgi:cadmium resistance protein CadD (predicted permease)